MLKRQTLWQTHLGRPRRGSAYVLVLTTALTVTVIGLSALLTARVQMRIGSDEHTTIQCRLMAQAYVDVVVQRLTDDPAWRGKHTNDVWKAPEPGGGATLAYKLVDEEDGDLANDDFQSVRLYAKASIGNVTRMHSVLLSPPAPVNALSNPGMENGLTDWNGVGCTLASRTDGPHGGAAYIQADVRVNAAAGPEQDITAAIDNGGKYYIDAWVKPTFGFNDKTVTITLDTTDGIQVESFNEGWSGVSWHKMSGTLTTSFTGSLNAAYLKISTGSGTFGFGIDDVVLIEVDPPVPVPGTWRREIE